MKEGKYKGMENSRMLLPPMPWNNFSQITDDDIHAIYAYLNSLLAVENVVPAAVLPSEM